jgi:hypothetical protein
VPHNCVAGAVAPMSDRAREQPRDGRRGTKTTATGVSSLTRFEYSVRITSAGRCDLSSALSRMATQPRLSAPQGWSGFFLYLL